jgi:tetratricopeptide (TPR) repeat protein
VDYFTRMLKQNNPLVDRSLVQYRLLRALSELGKHEEAMGQARDYLEHFPDAAERAEVRFIVAHSLKALGRNNEAMQQVLALLQEQKKQAPSNPEVWAYWQQRAGNEIANQLFRDGDYTKALDVYLSLAALNPAPAWQIPVQYQVGMSYEKLQQPQLATQTYSNILTRELTIGTNSSPGLKSLFDMARWRIGYLSWESHAESSARDFSPAKPALATVNPEP